LDDDYNHYGEESEHLHSAAGTDKLQNLYKKDNNQLEYNNLAFFNSYNNILIYSFIFVSLFHSESYVVLFALSRILLIIQQLIPPNSIQLSGLTPRRDDADL
jgi:hypothetical protein